MSNIGAYVGVGGVAKQVKDIYVGVNGIAKKVIKAYIGDANGIAKLWWDGNNGGSAGFSHVKQSFISDYTVGQTYSMSKANMKDTIGYAVMEYIYLDYIYDSMSKNTKDNMLNNLSNILNYFDNNVSPLADTITININRQNSTTLRMNISPSATNTSSVRISQKNIGNVCKEYFSISGLTSTTYPAFYCIITEDNITFNTMTSTIPNFIGVSAVFGDTPYLNITTNNIGVTYSNNNIDTYLAEWDYTQSVYDKVDELTIYGNVIQSSDGIQITSGRYVRLPAEFSYRGVSFEIKIGAMNCTNASTTHRLFTYMSQGQNQSYTGLEWLGSQNTWNIYNGTIGQSLDIHDANYFAYSTLKIDIDSNGIWKIYKNGTLLTTTTQMPLKTGTSGCYFLGSSYGGFNTVYVEELKINLL